MLETEVFGYFYFLMFIVDVHTNDALMEEIYETCTESSKFLQTQMNN